MVFNPFLLECFPFFPNVRIYGLAGLPVLSDGPERSTRREITKSRTPPLIRSKVLARGQSATPSSPLRATPRDASSRCWPFVPLSPAASLAFSNGWTGNARLRPPRIGRHCDGAEDDGTFRIRMCGWVEDRFIDHAMLVRFPWTVDFSPCPFAIASLLRERNLQWNIQPVGVPSVQVVSRVSVRASFLVEGVDFSLEGGATSFQIVDRR